MLKSKHNTPIQLIPFKKSEIAIKSSTDWSHDFYKIKQVHEKGYRGQGVKVGIIDTGIDLNHPAFRGADITYKNFTSEGDGDFNGHGNWVASRIVGRGVVEGYAPDCKLYVAKALTAEGGGRLNDLDRALDWLINVEKVDIISTSIGWTTYIPSIQDKWVRWLANWDGIWISAAGNDGQNTNGIDQPADMKDVISTGSHDLNLFRSGFSDIGIDLDLYSAGEGVIGAYKDGRVVKIDGTSMAAPTLAGILACLMKKLLNKIKVAGDKHYRLTIEKIISCKDLILSKIRSDNGFSGESQLCYILPYDRVVDLENGEYDNDGEDPIEDPIDPPQDNLTETERNIIEMVRAKPECYTIPYLHVMQTMPKNLKNLYFNYFVRRWGVKGAISINSIQSLFAVNPMYKTAWFWIWIVIVAGLFFLLGLNALEL